MTSFFEKRGAFYLVSCHILGREKSRTPILLSAELLSATIIHCVYLYEANVNHHKLRTIELFPLIRIGHKKKIITKIVLNVCRCFVHFLLRFFVWGSKWSRHNKEIVFPFSFKAACGVYARYDFPFFSLNCNCFSFRSIVAFVFVWEFNLEERNQILYFSTCCFYCCQKLQRRENTLQRTL